MISKYQFKLFSILGLLAVLSLSGCAQLPNMPEIFSSSSEANKDEQEPLTPSAEDENNQATVAEAALGDAQVTQTLSYEQQLLLQMQSAANLYKGSKKVLSEPTSIAMKQAVALFRQGQLEQARQQVNQVLTQDLHISSAVYVLLGDIELALSQQSEQQSPSRSERAKLAFERALDINSYDAKAANRLANMYRQQGDFERALSLYQQAIEGEPMQASSYRNRAILFDLYLNNKAKALEDYKKYAVLLDLKHKQLTENDSAQEGQIKSLNKDIKLVNRWLIDVERQLKKQQQQTAASGM